MHITSHLVGFGNCGSITENDRKGGGGGAPVVNISRKLLTRGQVSGFAKMFSNVNKVSPAEKYNV